MNKNPVILPATRSWREIPQPVKPRAMSREGRRRLTLQVLRAVGGACALVLGGWVAWQVAAVMRNHPKSLGGTVPAEPIGRHLALVTDGVLDQAWLVRTLALPKEATLAEVDLERLRKRVLADGQVASAAIIKNFPVTLAVHISERSPVARVMSEAAGGAQKPLLVARDGVAYEGLGYDPAMVSTLPWLDGIRLVRQGAGFAPIEGMDTVAELLARAKLEAEAIYRTWRVVSLARLQSDGEIEVRTREGLKVIFGAGPATPENFFGQLAKLDTILDTLSQNPSGQYAPDEIDLSLGSKVPVRLKGASPPLLKSAADSKSGGLAPSFAARPAAPVVSAFSPFKIHLN